jgi:heat shock protein HtpX
VVDGLCVVSGDQRPSLVLIDSSYPVAVAAVDADGGHVIGVSQQFVNVMSRVEVEAVAAHLLWRLRVGHARLTAYLFGLSRVLSLVGLGSVVQRIASASLPADLVTLADIAACQATRFPPAAVSALEKCDSSAGSVSVGMGEFLSFALPSDSQGDATSGHKVSNLAVSRPRLSERVAILKEM